MAVKIWAFFFFRTETQMVVAGLSESSFLKTEEMDQLALIINILRDQRLVLAPRVIIDADR